MEHSLSICALPACKDSSQTVVKKRTSRHDMTELHTWMTLASSRCSLRDQLLART